MIISSVIATISVLLFAAGGVARLSKKTNRQGAYALIAVMLGWVGTLLALTPDSLSHYTTLLGAVAAAGLILLITGGRLINRYSHWLFAAGGAVIAVRIPLTLGDETVMLLAPLYLVTMLITGGLIHEDLRSSAQTRDRVRVLDIAVVAFTIYASFSLFWSNDQEAGLIALACFLQPFLLLYFIVRSTRQKRRLIYAGYGFLTSAVVAAVIGLYQAVFYVVWWNPKVINANYFRPNFRTNSIFWDPNIFGRVLVFALILCLAWLLVRGVRVHGVRAHGARGGGVRRLNHAHAAMMIALFVLLLAALWTTYSQSSWVAFAAATLLFALLTLPLKARRWAAIAALVLAIALAPVAFSALTGSDVDGRLFVAQSGLKLAEKKPVLGWGYGSFATTATSEIVEAEELDDAVLVDSHTTPITVLTELGAVGAALYLLLITAALVSAVKKWRRAALAPAAKYPRMSVIFATGAIAALVAHSLFYAGFFEDAILWVALALQTSTINRTDLQETAQ